MDYGLFMFPAHDAIDPASLARLAEDAAFESLFFPEHTHIPASRKTPSPGGEPLGREYYTSLDPFVALTAAAAATTRLRIATGICLVAQRDPIVTAKAVASLDHLSGGRFLFGVGGGWNDEELVNHGVDPRRRFAVLEDRMEAMRAIWTQDEASYHGRFVDFDRIWSWPKPVQRPHPPILLAGNGPRVLERVVAWADGWCPLPFPDVPERVVELRARAAERGRDVTVSVLGLPVPKGAADLEVWLDAGVDRCVFRLPPAQPGEAERLVTAIRQTIDQVSALR